MPSKIVQKFVDFLFNNGKILFLLFGFLVIFGALSVSQMHRQGFPDISVNVAGVQVIYPNASADQVEKEVLGPIENEIAGIETVTEYESTASDSFGLIFVTFDAKADADEVLSDLRDAVKSVTLPEDAMEPVVSSYSVNGSGEFIVGVTGYPDGQQLYDAGESFEATLETVDGVKKVTPLNPISPEVVITFDARKLAKHKLMRSQVEQTIQTSQFAAPVGSFVEDGMETSIQVSQELEGLEDLKTLQIAPRVELQDVAEVTTRLNNNDYYNRIGYREFDENSELFIERALLYAIQIESDADILVVSDALEAELDVLNERDAETSGNFVMMYNQGDETRTQIEEITKSIFGENIEALGVFGFLGYLLGGLSFVVILMFLFMNWRVAVLSAISIPLSLFFAAIYLHLSGIDLNTIVLFSMVLVIGLVVDPTIVFLEALQRYREQGFSPREAAAKTFSTVGLGIFLAVVAHTVVFVPFGVVSGFFGQIIAYIPATVIPALVASIFVPALFYTPVAAYLLRPKKGVVVVGELAGTWKIGQVFGNAVNWLLGPGKMKAVLRVGVVLVIFALPFVVAGGLVSTKTVQVVQFASQDDSDFLLVNGSVNGEWTFEKSVYDVVVPMQNELAKQPEIKNFFYYSQQGNSFTIMATLLPMEERSEKDMRTSNELAADLNESFTTLNLDADIEASTSSEGPPQDSFPVRVRIFEDDLALLMGAVADVKTHLESQEGVKRVDDNVSQGTSGGSLTLAIDSQSGQNAFMTYAMLSDQLAENKLGKLEVENDSYEMISLMSPGINSQDELEMIVGSDANFVQKESVSIHRLNGERYAEVFASVEEGVDPLEVQAELESYLNADKLKELQLSEDAADFEGSADSIEESFSDLFLALAISIFLIYMILVAFFRSFVEPFIIILAIPLGLVGVFPALWVTTGQLGFLELLGVVAMAGMVVNLTILLIDYANQLQRQGKSPREAIATSVSVRFRPIVLTQMASFGGLIGLIFLSPFWKGLASAIVAGIIASAFLSFFTTPILYQWTHSSNELLKRVGKKFRVIR